MMPSSDDTIIDDGSVSRTEQMSAEASGTFVGQKINPLKEDFLAVVEAFNMHRNDYEEVKSRVYGAATEFYGTVAVSYTHLTLPTNREV